MRLMITCATKATIIVAKPERPANSESSEKPDRIRQTPKAPKKAQAVMTARRRSWASAAVTGARSRARDAAARPRSLASPQTSGSLPFRGRLFEPDAEIGEVAEVGRIHADLLEQVVDEGNLRPVAHGRIDHALGEIARPPVPPAANAVAAAGAARARTAAGAVAESG